MVGYIPVYSLFKLNYQVYKNLYKDIIAVPQVYGDGSNVKKQHLDMIIIDCFNLPQRISYFRPQIVVNFECNFLNVLHGV